MILGKFEPLKIEARSYLGEYCLFGKFISIKTESISRDSFFDYSTFFNNYRDFSKYHIDIDRSIESFYRIFNSIDKIPLIEKVLSSRSTEGFIDTVKSIAKKVIRAIILAVKAVINWLKTYLLAFGRFVRDKIFHKIFGAKKTRETLMNLVKAYDKYSDTSICNPFNNNKSKEALRYMNYKEDNFDIIGRTAAIASTAIDSMILALKKSKDENGNSIFVRNYQVRYGDEEEENRYVKFKNDNPLTTLSLYFYHEKSFMQFIYHIDKLTNGNISSLITERLHYGGDPDINTIELKIDLGVKGSDIAKAIILKCSLDKQKDIEAKAQNIDTDKIKIKDVISKEVLLRIVAGDSIILDKLQHESEYSLRACEELDIVYKDFEQRLLKYEQQLDKSNYKAIGKYIGVQEANTWINFMTTFIQTFMSYRTNMIHIVRRIIKILAKKSKEEQFVNFGKNNNIPISTRLYGPIKRLDEKHWERLSYSEILKDSKEIIRRHLINMHYNNRIPIYIIPIKDCIDDPKVEDIGVSGGTVGFNIGLYSESNNRPGHISNLVRILQLNSPGEKNALEAYIEYDKYLNALPDDISKNLNLIGSVVILNTHLYQIYNISAWREGTDNLFNYFSPSVLYYGTIVHETTHALQLIYNGRRFADNEFNDVVNNSSLEQKINYNRTNNYKEKLVDKTIKLAYNISPLHEREAFNEEYNFLMSTISEKDNIYKQNARNVLEKIGFNVTRLNLKI